MSTAKPRHLIALAGWLFVCLVAGAVGALASVRAATFYEQLSRPAWAPPPSVFGPVWTALYILMAIAAWLVWRQRGFSGARTALTLFIVQLAANALWTWLFFGWRQGALAFCEILLLWILILATLMSFSRVSRTAAILLVPYLAWVTFASALTYSVWQRNPQLLS